MLRRLIAAHAMWQRRLGVVLLTHYAKDAVLRDTIIAIVRPCELTRNTISRRRSRGWIATSPRNPVPASGSRHLRKPTVPARPSRIGGICRLCDNDNGFFSYAVTAISLPKKR